ncbi:hypothetical protein J7I98_04315 [Streptomyces sp. ISL-98]|uniref:WDGH domain-containing protein n=1 Tax=Streptomyces sp. ISL-98 TaxID=2819192 RepID=UPI001BEA3A93|nr:hypothetical protein [Streptomyces sp. ISL-98]MBT2505132.1 hypothetical protein [Streptomyces sp. ISL-98]
MTEPRHTADTITDDALDQLYDRAAEGERLRLELANQRETYEDACQQIAAMHAAAVGEVTGPNRGVVEDVADVREAMLRAEQERDGAYRERAHFVAYLASLYPAHIGHTDPDAPDWAVVIVQTPAGQMSWHVTTRDMDLFEHVPRSYPSLPGWDGHTTDQKYERLRALTLRRKH